MDAVKRRKIQDIAEKIHYTLDLQAPVDLKAVTKTLGGKVIGRDLPEEIDAQIEKSGDAFKIIVNNKKTNTRRKNFSIAHEFGHLFIHMGYLINPGKWESVSIYTDSVYYRFGHDEEELEANEFAAAFLMPEKKYREKIKELTDKKGLCDISKVADHFGVSREAALNRGRWLDIFSWE